MNAYLRSGPPSLSDAQREALYEALRSPVWDGSLLDNIAPVVARMLAEARSEGWQEGRQWDLLDTYSETIREIALSNVRLRREVREAYANNGVPDGEAS